MPELDRYIAGVPCWIDTSQPDPEAAVAFYGDLFGWDVESVMPADAPGEYFMARIGGGDVAGIGSIPEGAPPMAMWNTYIWVDSADETAAKVKDAGGAVITEPFDVMSSGRMGVFADPEGAVFCVWEPNEHRGARVVNEPGSLNFNGLNTRDLDGAKAFYGPVFGWQTLELDGGALAWTLPGYGDHLELLNPGTLERMASFGAVKGFEDVVASVLPIQAGHEDMPAHWTVTFATADADATAEKASALGGKLLAPPFDAPWVRMTIIADPQGATFIASQFAPQNRDVPAPGSASVSAA